MFLDHKGKAEFFYVPLQEVYSNSMRITMQYRHLLMSLRIVQAIKHDITYEMMQE